LGGVQAVTKGFGFSVKTLFTIAVLGCVFLFTAGAIHSFVPSLLGSVVAFVVGICLVGILLIKFTNVRLMQKKSKKVAK
jgi:hypothetical protein